MHEPPHWPREAWIPLLAGLYWLWDAPSHGFVGFLFSVVPGGLLLGSGVSMLLMPGDLRISQFTAAGGVAGAVLAVPAVLFAGFGDALLMLIVSAASFVAGGLHTLRLEPHPEGVPRADENITLAAQVAIDDALLSSWTILLPLALGSDHKRIAGEIKAARELFESEDWLAEPGKYHEAPPVLDTPRLVDASSRGLDYEHLSFPSGYEPRQGEPGRDRWLGYARNRTAHAWVLRDRAAPRPCLVCIHGYQMGSPLVDLRAFQVERLGRSLGLDVVLAVLPLHGPRKEGRLSGDGFLSGDVLDTVHAEAQAMWDVRRLLTWIRAQGAPAIGVYGLSLGGYNAALLSCLEDDLACAIPGVPAVDFSHLMFRHGPPLQVRQIELEVELSHVEDVFRPVSPLALTPRVAPAARAIFAGIADRIVPAEQVVRLWRHWGEPSIEWYAGAHCTFAAHDRVGELVSRTLREHLST